MQSDLLSEIQNAFNSDTKNLIVQNVGTQYDPLEVCLDRNVAETVNHVYKHKVGTLRTFTSVPCIFLWRIVLNQFHIYIIKLAFFYKCHEQVVIAGVNEEQILN